MATGRIRGVLFDKDGTLFDFNATWAGLVDRVIAGLSDDPETRLKLGEAVGFDVKSGRFVAGSAVVAGSVAEIAQAWAAYLPQFDPEKIEAMANRLGSEVGPSELVPACADLPGFLAGLKARGCALGVATHDQELAARAHLAAVGALDHFDFIAGYDSGHGLKPGPGMLLAFAAAAGIAPGEVAMLGDSRHDLQMVPNAGAALSIGVLTGPATEADLAPYADHVLPSIAELPALLDRLGL